jgi:hypothetical protein
MAARKGRPAGQAAAGACAGISSFDNTKRKVIHMANEISGASSQSKMVLALVCFFVGFLGIHRFMVGKIGTGVLMIVTFGGLGLWVLIDFIMILMGKFSDKQGRPVTA